MKNHYQKYSTAALAVLRCNRGWKVCPQCREKVQGGQRASLDITDSTVLIKQTDESKTVDHSVKIGGDVSGTVTIGDTVNVSTVIKIESINIQTLHRDEIKALVKSLLLDAIKEAGIVAKPLRGKPKGLSDDQSHIATAVRRKVEEAEEKFGSDVLDPNIYTLLGNAALMSGDKERATQDIGSLRTRSCSWVHKQNLKN